MAETRQVLHQNRARVARARFAGLAAAIAVGTSDARAAETRPIDDAIVLGPGRCLQRGALSRRLRTWLGADVVDASISIAIDEDPGAVRFVLRRDGAVVGERTIAVGDDGCDDVTAAVALAIASAIEVATRGDDEASEATGPAADASPSPPDAPVAPGSSNGAPGTSDPAPAPAPTPAPPAAPTPSPSPPRSSAAAAADAGPASPDEAGPRSRRGALAVTVEAAGLVGVFPRPAFAIAPAASLGGGERVEIRLSAIGAVPVVAELEPAGTAEVGLYAGRIDGCGGDHLLDGHVWIRGCGGLSAGGVAAEGVDVEDPSSSVGAWIALAARAELHWMPTTAPIGIALSLDGFVPVVRPRLQVLDGDRQAIASRDLPLLGASAALGPCVLF